MTYSAHIDRKNPTCFVFLVDQSASMQEQCSGRDVGISKSQALCDGINASLREIVILCGQEDGIIFDYFYIAVIGYGERIYSLFNGLVPVSGMEKLARVEEHVDPVSGAKFKVRIWLDAVADGNTPMCAALADALVLVKEWVRNHPKSFPAIVLNITDGEANDGVPVEIAEQLRSVSGSDGSVLLFNGHLSSVDSGTIEFPVATADLPDDPYAHLLFGMSSIIPESMRKQAELGGIGIKPGGRGMVFNADFTAVTNLLDVGTLTARPR